MHLATRLSIRILPLLVALPAVSWAGPSDNWNAAFTFHIEGRTAKHGCEVQDEHVRTRGCESFTTGGPILTPLNVYLFVVQGDAAAGIAGISLGIDYPEGESGLWLQWDLCADLEFPNGNWPAAGGGNRITWNAATNCQRTTLGVRGVHALAGVFYTYAYGTSVLSITRNEGVMSGPEIVVADCSAQETEADSHFGCGFATFGPGFSPSFAHPCGSCFCICSTESTTWGAIKAKYDRGTAARPPRGAGD